MAVEGCFWAAPYEVIFIDFFNPMQALKKLEHQPHGYNPDFFGWNNDGTANIGYEECRRKSDGKLFEYLTDEEEDKAINEDDLEDVKISVVWKLDGTIVK